MRHADSLRSGGRGAAEQFDSASFFHARNVSDLTPDCKRAYHAVIFNQAYMSTLQDRIAELMATTGWSVGRIAEIAEVSSPAVTQWKDGPTQSISLLPAVKLSDASGFSALWLSAGKGQKMVALRVSEGDPPEYAGASRRQRLVPVVGTAKLGSDGFYEELSSVVGAGDGHIEIATQDPNAYGLRVRGQSMFPAIRDGWYVLIEPNSQPRIGEYVLIKLRDGRKMVKELLVKRPGSVEVMSVNGNERMTFDLPDVDSMQAVGAVVSPSKWMPD